MGQERALPVLGIEGLQALSDKVLIPRFAQRQKDKRNKGKLGMTNDSRRKVFFFASPSFLKKKTDLSLEVISDEAMRKHSLRPSKVSADISPSSASTATMSTYSSSSPLESFEMS